ncbi:prolipoprotein diacylglyceryl transferase [Halobacteroides halobius DSM 5150]|uniref:Phosphatidylglycerol--prolipoprotein diacylglyceryl transferase n=1 Tax=Halobacteroides halobius (strain ATCC 35273 / DSM 5150 / MD-1) TaxID=748449 RepID=L0KBR2_HALHC|nr:prolipoprotein diacylglyceryl transferase [Halobacteroides halobius]AGB42446.1 prolipoprotein diacylglyceryl transferase [Halobacteroides halobius DSM 5150]
MNSTYLDPIAFKLGPLTVYWYGIIMASAVLIGLLLATNEAKRRNIDPELIIDLVIWGIPCAIIGARTYYVIFQWDYYSQHPQEIIAIWHGGLAIHGALIAALLAGVTFAYKKGVSFLKLTDIAAPSIILGQAIGRWGNFMNQEAHGGPVSRNFLESLHLPYWIIEQMQINGIYYHPTFLYESIWNLLVFLFLTLYWKKQDFLKPGEVFLSYISLYSFGRFFIEEMRTDSLMLGSFKMAKVISVVIILFSVGIGYYNHYIKN